MISLVDSRTAANEKSNFGWWVHKAITRPILSSLSERRENLKLAHSDLPIDMWGEIRDLAQRLLVFYKIANIRL